MKYYQTDYYHCFSGFGLGQSCPKHNHDARAAWRSFYQLLRLYGVRLSA